MFHHRLAPHGNELVLRVAWAILAGFYIYVKRRLQTDMHMADEDAHPANAISRWRSPARGSLAAINIKWRSEHDRGTRVLSYSIILV